MISNLRKQFPQYDDMSDSELIDGIYRKFYSDISEEEFYSLVIPRPNHDDLETAAVTGADSLELQEMAPEIKPVVKMTTKEVKQLRANGNFGKNKALYLPGNGTAYVIDTMAVRGIYGASALESIRKAKIDLRKGGDAEGRLLGYPPRAGHDNTIDVAVSKSGEIISDLPTMKAEAEQGNIAWAAEGEQEEALQFADKVSATIRSKNHAN